MLKIGREYKDGWGVPHTVGGITKVNPDWVWTLQGNWYRQSDGRRIGYVLSDPSKPDGPRKHVPASTASNWDLKVG